jgi:hypothetical protein
MIWFMHMFSLFYTYTPTSMPIPPLLKSLLNKITLCYTHSMCVCLCIYIYIYIYICIYYIYFLKKQVVRTSHGRDFDDSLEKCEDYLNSRPCMKPQHSARTLLVHSAPSTVPKHCTSPVLNRVSLRER